ncbi:10781_t:CDS:2 [Funneliformis caledonium]|uniref:10781_t:CDS:1 n=1 Tax=Funneliformis caledonium TaxID=1117310 RepID=A0A9N9E3K2_9GLOM|nr:10781_t:CDS:2 [Funneliformis caledonium]
MGPVVDSNEAMRCEYILTILYTAVSLLEGLLISLQMTVTGVDSSSRVDYTIKKIIKELFEEIICITEGKQNQPGKSERRMKHSTQNMSMFMALSQQPQTDALDDPAEL